LELRTYTVPEGFSQDEWSNTLRKAFQVGETRIGSVTPGPSNTLVVTAPRNVHLGIQALVKDLIARGPVTAPESVSVNYWILLARPLEAGATESPVRIAPDQRSRMEILEPVLDQIAAVQGPLEYHLLEQLQLSSADANQSSDLRGRLVSVSQRVMDDGRAGWLADIDISMSGSHGVLHNVRSRVRLEPGKFVILGQTAYNGKNGPLPGGWDPFDDLMLYYVIARDSD
jgi:hypothetical protein